MHGAHHALVMHSGSGIIMSRGLFERVNVTQFETCVNTLPLKYGPPKGGDIIMSECL
jgi:hypothetical protein